MIERAGKEKLIIEIKSSTEIRLSHLKNFEAIGADIPNAELVFVARVPRAQQCENVLVLAWREALKKYFLIGSWIIIARQILHNA